MEKEQTRECERYRRTIASGPSGDDDGKQVLILYPLYTTHKVKGEEAGGTIAM